MTQREGQMLTQRDQLRSKLRHVRWIGGSPGAGKSTIALALAESFNLQLFTVEPFSKYANRLTPEQAPLLHAFLAMDMDERWLRRPPTVMFEKFHGFQDEGFDLIVEDLLAKPSDRLIIAEGFKLLPRLVAPLLSDRRHQAIWLLPTPDFRRRALELRGSTWEIPNKTSDPERALANLSARDELFTAELTRAVHEQGLSSLKMNGISDTATSLRQVAETLDLLSGGSDVDSGR